MSKLAKQVSGFAVMGFVVAAALTTLAFANAALVRSYFRICLLFCPPLFLSMKDQSSVAAAGFIWFIICVANATLYGLVGLFFGLLFSENSTASK